MSTPARNGQGFVAGSLIGTLGGLIGLGGAEFRLPVLVGVFRFNTLEAVILNKAMSLVVVAAALLFRGGRSCHHAIPAVAQPHHPGAAGRLGAGHALASMGRCA